MLSVFFSFWSILWWFLPQLHKLDTIILFVPHKETEAQSCEELAWGHAVIQGWSWNRSPVSYCLGSWSSSSFYPVNVPFPCPSSCWPPLLSKPNHPSGLSWLSTSSWKPSLITQLPESVPCLSWFSSCITVTSNICQGFLFMPARLQKTSREKRKQDRTRNQG